MGETRADMKYKKPKAAHQKMEKTKVFIAAVVRHRSIS